MKITRPGARQRFRQTLDGGHTVGMTIEPAPCAQFSAKSEGYESVGPDLGICLTRLASLVEEEADEYRARSGDRAARKTGRLDAVAAWLRSFEVTT